MIKVFKNLKKHVKNANLLLTKKEIDYLLNFQFTSGQFYCLPKVHKYEKIKNTINTENSEYIQVHCPVLYLQLLGTAMCTKCAPLYACLIVGYLEETKCFPKYLNTQKISMKVNARYLQSY